jgi:hypothetical protein
MRCAADGWLENRNCTKACECHRDPRNRGDEYARVRADMEQTMFFMALVQDGIAVRHAGLIYRLPLCHDFGINESP